tara:strand:- start:4591 stop:5484 length:894 start_codon:yes stop_codon:yes gene_type:complete
MKILVTGSSGFVGKLLIEELARLGHEVEGFDSSHGKNILNLTQVKQAVKGKQVVFHLAASLDETKPKEMLEVNVKGTENVVEASAKASVSQFVFLSTVGVHGNATKVNENSPLKPETMYEASKARAEKIVWESQEMLPITIVRSALVLGPNKYWAGIVKLAKKGFPLIGNGKNHFQTIYIKDLISALTFVLEKSSCFGEVFVVSGKEKPTLRELYSLIRKKIGLDGEVKTIPAWLGKVLSYIYLLKSKISGKPTVVLPQHVNRLVRERNYDTKKITLLGWDAKYSLEKAVEETIKGQ